MQQKEILEKREEELIQRHEELITRLRNKLQLKINHTESKVYLLLERNDKMIANSNMKQTVAKYLQYLIHTSYKIIFDNTFPTIHFAFYDQHRLDKFIEISQDKSYSKSMNQLKNLLETLKVSIKQDYEIIKQTHEDFMKQFNQFHSKAIQEIHWLASHPEKQLTSHISCPSFEKPGSLWDVIRRGDVNAIKKRLSKSNGSNVNLVDLDTGMTPLMFACKFNQFPVAELLICDFHALVEIPNTCDYNKIALHYSCQYSDNVSLVALLLGHGNYKELLEYRDNQHRSALDFAILYNHPCTIRFLRSMLALEEIQVDESLTSTSIGESKESLHISYEGVNKYTRILVFRLNDLIQNNQFIQSLLHASIKSMIITNIETKQLFLFLCIGNKLISQLHEEIKECEDKSPLEDTLINVLEIMFQIYKAAFKLYETPFESETKESMNQLEVKVIVDKEVEAIEDEMIDIDAFAAFFHRENTFELEDEDFVSIEAHAIPNNQLEVLDHNPSIERSCIIPTFYLMSQIVEYAQELQHYLKLPRLCDLIHWCVSEFQSSQLKWLRFLPFLFELFVKCYDATHTSNIFEIAIENYHTLQGHDPNPNPNPSSIKDEDKVLNDYICLLESVLSKSYELELQTISNSSIEWKLLQVLGDLRMREHNFHNAFLCYYSIFQPQCRLLALGLANQKNLIDVSMKLLSCLILCCFKYPLHESYKYVSNEVIVVLSDFFKERNETLDDRNKKILFQRYIHLLSIAQIVFTSK